MPHSTSDAISRFDGRNVLITGASRGLGAAMAVAFGASGARMVVVGYRTHREKAEEVVRLVEEGGAQGMALALDVRNQQSVDEAIAEMEAADILTDVLINNAAITRDAWMPMMSSDDWEEVVNVNLSGTFRCCRAVVRGMLARRSGVIINVGSVAGLHASPGQASYAASKGGVVALTKTMAAEFAPRGIRVNAVIPGLIASGMGSRLDHRVAKKRTDSIPVGRFGEAHEVADAVLFMASDAARYIVGQSLVVDGGLTL